MWVRTVLFACMATAGPSLDGGGLGLTTGIAHAQPLDPYAPAPKQPPAPPPPAPAPLSPVPAAPPAPAPVPPDAPAPSKTADDPVLAEQIAVALVQRAQELFDARVFVDAKQLAVEALVRSPQGAAAHQARYLISAINKQLGITDEPEVKPADKPDDKVDLTPITDPIGTGKLEEPPDTLRAGRLTSGIHSALYAGLLGATVGSFLDDDSPAKGAVPIGLGTGLVAGLYLPRALDKLEWHDAQIRTVGSASVWGGVIGGLFADAVDTDGTRAKHVLLGASIGSTVGVLGGAALARKNKLSRGDVALIDTLAGIGTLGGFTMGMLMQPAESEAYSVNAILGATAGVLVGTVAAGQTNTTPRRMARVAGLAAAGGALPFLLYAGIYDDSSSTDERVTGLLSTGGMLAGAYLGFRMTKRLDVDLDVVPGKPRPVEDAPISLIGRHSDGSWALNGLAVQPLSPVLAPQPGMTVPVVGGAW